MRHSLLSFVCSIAVLGLADGGRAAGGVSAPVAGRTEQVLGDGWRFAKGAAPQAALPSFDDSAWATVHVPHDWGIHEPFHAGASDPNARFNWHGESWYRRSLALPASAAGQRVYLDFDGVMAFPEVYVNGKLAGGWDYGYNSFRVDATDLVRFGAVNVVAVHADTRAHESRWYAGAGIYRKVTLVLTAPVHIGQWGTVVTTPQVSSEQALVDIVTTVDNHLQVAQTATVTTRVFAVKDGAPSAIVAVAQATLAPGSSLPVHQQLTVVKPQLWAPGHASMYRAVSTVAVNGVALDEVVTPFGIRSLQFTADDGLHVNGQRVQIHGVDLHHDLGPLGAAFHRRAAQRQLEIMQDMGVNAIRTSHNPPAPELLDLADEMGILVLAECFDKWDRTVDRRDGESLATFGRRQLGAFVRRDRNHPSIMLWSVGNEIWDVESNANGHAADDVAMMANLVREFDPTRGVTLATHLSQSVSTGIHRALDVLGWNYGDKYTDSRTMYPDKPVLMTESASAVSTRGYYQLTPPRFKDDFPATPALDSFDFNAVSWGDIADVEFARIAAHPYLAGEFVWSGFDYIGEPTPYEALARSSYFGIVDLVGLPKDRFFLYRSYWQTQQPTLHILPHWTWPQEQVGKGVPVVVYTDGDAAELFLNGKSLGMRSKIPPASLPPLQSYYDVTKSYRLRWDAVPYAPGELQVVAYRNGQAIGKKSVFTAGPKAAVQLQADRQMIGGDGDDLAFVTVNIVDAAGHVVPEADELLQLSITGPGALAGVGNGDPTSADAMQAQEVRLFHGQAVVIVKGVGKAGSVELKAAAAGLTTGSVHLEMEPAPASRF